ncbi:hypothetical protein GCM10023206_26380 [Acinetobacter puyangensis]|uniref:DUF6160 domain-containing protein n=1 Tax=Acinetobacter puyangensis TaxID=1096779 RepID=A0A240E5Q9_9GAMM|nr:DUF6160 family protein [Acinetobacter puyangensis]SNX43593.1 hypothetical protein SAMN05421731_101635 [Acinetobacter puyangensis]
MKNRNDKKNKLDLRLNPLVLSVLLIAQNSYAMQALDDHDLSAANAQEGVYIETTYNALALDNLYWEDQAGSANGEKALRISAENIKVGKNKPTDVLGTSYQIQMGSNADKAGLDLKLSSNHSLIEIENFKICDTASTVTCSPEIGSLGIQSTEAVTVHFKTEDGLFNSTSPVELELGLKNINIYLGQENFSVANTLNQLVLRNFNFNFKGRGTMEIDAIKGLYIATGADGYVDFNRVNDTGIFTTAQLGTYSEAGQPTNAGLNLEFMLKKDVADASPYLMDSYNAPANATGLIRVGASGRMVNGYLQLRGTDANDSGLTAPSGYATDNTNILGFADNNNSNPSVIGSTGIGFRMRGEFTNQNDAGSGGDLTQNSVRPVGSKTSLEIGGAGLNTYGFEFTNLTALRSDLSNRAYFDSGNVYINLTDTKTLLMPYNYVFQTSRFGGASDHLTNDVDYQQNIHTGTGANPYALVAAIRGAEFQAISRQGRFTNSAGVVASDRIDDSSNNEWGLALPFYNLNANMAIYGSTTDANTIHYYTTNGIKTAVGVAGAAQRLGFSLAMSTEGIDKDASNNAIGDKTTSILVIDGGNNPRTDTPTDYYMGLRNVDMLLNGTGSIGVENGSLNIALPNVLIVMAGEVAAGYLPGAAYKTCPVNAVRCAAPTDNFAKKDDVLFGLKLRLGGDMSFSLIPNSEIQKIAGINVGSRLNIVGEVALNEASKNTIQISDPADGSILGLDNLTGKIGFNNAIVIDRYSALDNRGVVGFHAELHFNPEGNQAGVFRAKDINFYPEMGAGQRLGEIALTGGTLNSRFNIVPRN